MLKYCYSLVNGYIYINTYTYNNRYFDIYKGMRICKCTKMYLHTFAQMWASQTGSKPPALGAGWAATSLSPIKSFAKPWPVIGQ